MRVVIAVNKEKQHRKKIVVQQEQRDLAAIAAKQKQQEQRLQDEQAIKAEQLAITDSLLKHRQAFDEITKKMVAVCNKVWTKGKHRCYCEKYIEYAPAGIKSNPSCSG